MPFNFEDARSKMIANNLDALVAFSPENVFYTSGCLLSTSQLIRDRLSMTLIPREGEPTIMVCNIEESFVRENAWIKNVRSYVEFQTSPMELLATVLKEQGLSHSAIGIEKMYLQTAYFETLSRTLPEATFEDDGHIFNDMRIIKRPDEIDLLERAAVATEKAVQLAYESAGRGETELSIATTMRQNLVKFGADQIAFLVLGSGRKTYHAHPIPTDNRIETGEVITTDIGGVFSGYYSDLTRMAVMGSPRKRDSENYRKVRATQREIIDKVRVGTQASKLYEVCLNSFREKGLRFHMPHVGHGLGIGLHEEPLLNPFNNRRLEAGMVLAVEPFSVEPQVAGFGIEDMIVVTDSEPRILSHHTDTEDLYIIR
jgi:Xaa-Pro aminopeptidase